MQQVLLRLPEQLFKAIDSFVDKDRFKNRTQFILTVLADWIVKERYPQDPYAAAFWGEDNAETEPLLIMRNKLRRELLGDEWDKYKDQNADLFDGQWESERAVESQLSKEEEENQRQQLKAAASEELRVQIAEDLREELKIQIAEDLRRDLLKELKKELKQIVTEKKGRKK